MNTGHSAAVENEEPSLPVRFPQGQAAVLPVRHLGKDALLGKNENGGIIELEPAQGSERRAR